MRPPVPISTLADAAKWMSELSGALMTEREVLGHAFNFQWAAERAQRTGEHSDEMPDAVKADRIVHALLPGDVDLRMRQWRIDGYTDRPATREQRIVALDSFELFDLLTYDSVDLTLPRLTDQYESDEYAELILDGAVATYAMLRIYTRGLHILAAWWRSTVGMRAPRGPAVPAAPMLGDAAPSATRNKPAGGDALTALVWGICYDLLEIGQRPTAGPVMTELKVRADSSDPRLKGPLLSSVAGGVKYEDSNGTEKELNAAQLAARISEWRKACFHG
jgi:hypothetical protein